MGGMIRLVALALVLAGCSGGTTQIDITLVSDESVTDAMLAAGRTLHVDATGADDYKVDLPLPAERGLLRTEKLVYKARATSGSIRLGIVLEDSTGTTLAFAYGDFDVVLDPGHAKAVTLMMGRNGTPQDGGDDGSMDLAGLDMGPFVGGASKCPVGGALLCEGWEAGPYPGFWNFGSPPSPTVDTAQAARGAHALHMTLPAVSTGYQAIGAGEQMTFPHNPPIYVRFFVLVEQRINFVANLMRLDQVGGSNQALNLGLQPNGAINIDTTSISPGFERSSSTAVLPLNQWTCLEVMYDGITDGNEKVWMNDVEVTDVGGAGVNANNPFDEMVLFFDYNATGPVPATSLWYDEVVISTTRIGCAN
jgi:hypothetical protein